MILAIPIDCAQRSNSSIVLPKLNKEIFLIMPIRQIIRDAFQVDELVHQFTVLDVEDGLLETGSEKEVNENKDYSDRYIIEEARNRLTLLEKQITKLDEEHEDDSTYRIELQFLEQEKSQLLNFIKKWGPQEVFEE